MALQMRERMLTGLAELRFDPTSRRVRGLLDGDLVVDSTRAALVWEPGRAVPVYGVPAEDIVGELEPAGPAVVPGPVEVGQMRGSQDFRAHTTAGRPMVLRAAGGREVLAFRPDDPALEGRVLLEFRGLDRWLEEDDPVIGHPRDPYHRIDVRRSSRSVRVAVGGVEVAASSQPHLLYETLIPVVRSYLPPEDVRTDLLRPSPTRSVCAYKGEASYWSLQLGDTVAEDVVWCYENPEPEAAAIAGLFCFFDERVDVVVDGVPRERPLTPWSPGAR